MINVYILKWCVVVQYILKRRRKIQYPSHDNSHFHVQRLLHEQFIITWFIKEAWQPCLVPNPTKIQTNESKLIKESEIIFFCKKKCVTRENSEAKNEEESPWSHTIKETQGSLFFSIYFCLCRRKIWYFGGWWCKEDN